MIQFMQEIFDGMKTFMVGMKVTGGEFEALVGDLVATLDKFSVPEDEKAELLGVLEIGRAHV